MPQLKIPHAAAKSQCSKISIFLKSKIDLTTITMKCPHYGAIPWKNSWPPGGGLLCWVSSVTEVAVIFPYWDRQFCEGVSLPYLFCFCWQYHLWTYWCPKSLNIAAGQEAHLGAAKRSYPTSEVRGSGRECQAATAEERIRGATPRLRSGAEAGRTPFLKGGSQVELPHVRGQGQRPRVPDCEGAGTAERSYPTSEVKGGGREELPRVRGQGQWPRGATPHPRSSGCRGAGGPRGAIPR